MMKRALSFYRNEPLRLLYAAEREKDLLYQGELNTWAQYYPQFRYDPIVFYPPAGWQGLQGNLLQEVEHCYVRSNNEWNRRFFICGVGSQVTFLRDVLRRAGYERRAVQYEKW